MYRQIDGQTDVRTDGRTDRQTDRYSDKHCETEIRPIYLWGPPCPPDLAWFRCVS